MPETPPADRRYLKTHEWHRLTDDGHVEIGISAAAVDELTDITFLEINTEGEALSAGDAMGEIESVKATSDLYCGVAGTVVEVNEAAVERPELINEDCYGAGWIARVKPDDPAELDSLLDAAAYAELI